MKRFLHTTACRDRSLPGFPAAAQNAVPEIAFDSAANPLKLPDDIYLGEVAGVATNSKGDIFVYTRTGHPTISLGSRARSRTAARGCSSSIETGNSFARSDRTSTDSCSPSRSASIRRTTSGSSIRWRACHEVRSERACPDAAGQKARGHSGSGARAAAAPAGGGGRAAALPGAGAQSDVFNRPTDVAWDAAGNIFVADGIGNARVAKFDSNGVFVKSWGSRGTRARPVRHGPRRLRSMRRAMSTSPTAATSESRCSTTTEPSRRSITNVGTPAALCITPGPNQFLYSSNSNPPDDIDVAGEIYKMKLDGTIVGKFGRAGKLLKEFGTVNAIDCRSENNLLVGEIGNMRVQKLTLH